MAEPLSNVRVAEIGDDVAVRYLGRLLAALGADVRRQARAAGDERIGYAGAAGAAYGAWLDARKHGWSDPPHPVDLIIAGLDADSLAEAEALQAKLGGTLVSLSWFDPAGPYAAWQGSDELVTALVGLAYPFGARERPTLAQGHIPQLTAGVVAFNAAMAALLSAARPAQIDVNVLEATTCYTEHSAIAAWQGGPRSARLGVNRFSPTYPCSSYRAADGWVGVTCLTPAQWSALCVMLGRPELASDPRYATTLDRLAAADEVDTAIGELFATRGRDEWARLGVEHRIPITAMPRPGELPHVPHWQQRGAFARFGAGAVEAPTLPWRASYDGVLAEPWRSRGPGGPLAGLRVVDFSMGWAGPLCARTLADLGANVVKIESTGHPDWWRGWESGADLDARERATNFINVNRGKLGADIDLTRDEGTALARDLIADADVVIENYAAGVLDKLGLGPAVQRALKPGIISLSMPACGNGGPLSGLRAYGSTVEQASGLPFVNGEADWPPALQHVALGDPIAGLYAAAAVLSALVGRSRLGGAEIDLAQVACLSQLGADAIIAEQLSGAPLPRTGSARPRAALTAVVPALGDDAWLVVQAADRAAHARIAFVAGGPEIETVARWSAARPADAAAEQLQAAGIAAAPVRPSHSLTQDPQHRGAGYFVERDRKVVGPHQESAAPYRIDGARPRLRAAAPLLGEHMNDILAAREQRHWPRLTSGDDS